MKSSEEARWLAFAENVAEKLLDKPPPIAYTVIFSRAVTLVAMLGSVSISWYGLYRIVELVVN